MQIPSAVQVLRKVKRNLKPFCASMSSEKRAANRLYRRQLNGITRGFAVDAFSFDNETYQVKSYTSWDYV